MRRPPRGGGPMSEHLDMESARGGFAVTGRIGAMLDDARDFPRRTIPPVVRSQSQVPGMPYSRPPGFTQKETPDAGDAGVTEPDGLALGGLSGG